MIRLEGRALEGLDEFMLRVGHLKVLCLVGEEFGGSRHQLERELAEALTAPTAVTGPDQPFVADYLLKKRLCREEVTTSRVEAREESAYRYPDLAIAPRPDGSIAVRDTAAPGKTPTVWFQDWCLAAEGVQSAVGAVTVEAKSGSSTGVAHVADWAERLDLITRSGQLTAEGHLLAALTSGSLTGVKQQNPYLILDDRILLMWLVARGDTDVFSRFVAALAGQEQVIQKRAGAELFLRVMRGLVEEAEQCTDLSTRQAFHLSNQLRELERAARRAPQNRPIASTVWHRASSRLETYVDLGLLQKGSKSSNEKYEYVYARTPLIEQICASLNEATTIGEWCELRMVESLLGAQTRQEPLSREEFRAVLPTVVSAVKSPAALPLDVMAVGLATRLASDGSAVSIDLARRSLEVLAREHSDIARLSRGSAGQRAEYINIELRRL
jgi:hypothetical protein